MTKALWRETLSELLGTMVLLLFGLGSVAMVVLFQDPSNPAILAKGGYTNIVLGWGFAVMLGIYVAGAVSGAHLNPAVTLALAITKRFDWVKVLPYILAQLLGAFIGAAIVFTVYYAKWVQVDPMFMHTAGIFATFPEIKHTMIPGLVDQIVGTALLLFLILSIGNKPGHLTPLVIGFLVVAIGISFGGMHGYAINPARDFGPRLFSYVAGFSNTGFENGVWIVGVVGPFIGGILGALLYDRTIGCIETPMKNAEK